MTITNVKAMMAKVATVGLIAGALIVTSPTKAQAQVRFGVQIGTPVYEHVRPVYGQPVYVQPGYGYYNRGGDFRRREEFERHQAFERQQAIERQEAFQRAEAHARWERFHGYDRGHDHGYDRGHENEFYGR